MIGSCATARWRTFLFRGPDGWSSSPTRTVMASHPSSIDQVWPIARPGLDQSVNARSSEDGAGLVAVELDLRHQGLDPVELHLAAEAGDEAHLGRLAVEVAVEVEQVRL